MGTLRNTQEHSGTPKDTSLIQFYDDLIGTGKSGEIKERKGQRSVEKEKVSKVKGSEKNIGGRK